MLSIIVLSAIMLSVIMLSVIMLSAIMLSVVVPFEDGNCDLELEVNCQQWMLTNKKVCGHYNKTSHSCKLYYFRPSPIFASRARAFTLWDSNVKVGS